MTNKVKGAGLGCVPTNVGANVERSRPWGVTPQLPSIHRIERQQACAKFDRIKLLYSTEFDRIQI